MFRIVLYVTVLQKNLQLYYSVILNVKLQCRTIVNENTIFYSFPLLIALTSSLCLSQLLPPHSLSHISLVQSLHRCWVWILDRQVGFGSVGWDRLMVGLDRLIGGFEMVDLLIGGWIV